MQKAIAKLQKSVSKKEVAVKSEPLDFFTQKLGLKVVKTGFKVALPTKQGIKQYDAVEFNNGRVAVYIFGGKVLKYTWN